MVSFGEENVDVFLLLPSTWEPHLGLWAFASLWVVLITRRAQGVGSSATTLGIRLNPPPGSSESSNWGTAPVLATARRDTASS